MFIRKLTIERIDSKGAAHPCPIQWIDNFAMRNFTNDAIFDDTLPIADGLLEAGNRVPLDQLRLKLAQGITWPLQLGSVAISITNRYFTSAFTTRS